MNFCRPGKSLRASPSTALSFLLPICPLLTCIFNPSTALFSRTVSSYSFRSLPICDNRYLSQSGRLLLFYANCKFLLLSLPSYLQLGTGCSTPGHRSLSVHCYLRLPVGSIPPQPFPPER